MAIPAVYRIAGMNRKDRVPARSFSVRMCEGHSAISRAADANKHLGPRHPRHIFTIMQSLAYPRPVPVIPCMMAVIAVQIVVLLLVGRDIGCECGNGFLWQMEMNPLHNSQHFSDPYSFLHFGFGMAVFAVLAAMRPHWRRRDLLLLVVISSAIWEIVENLPFVISAFGYEPGDAQFYDGDSILNSMGDTAFALAGGALAAVLPLWATVLIIVGTELAVSFAIRDGYVIGLLRAAGLG